MVDATRNLTDKHGNLTAATLGLLTAALEVARTSWRNSAADREKLRSFGASLEVKASGYDTEPVYLRVSTFERVYLSMALGAIRKKRFVPRDIAQFEPKNSSDWIDRWPIIEDPVIADWFATNGKNYPSLFGWAISVDYVRRLLIEIRNSSASTSPSNTLTQGL
jgi:hypothetical protein